MPKQFFHLIEQSELNKNSIKRLQSELKKTLRSHKSRILSTPLRQPTKKLLVLSSILFITAAIAYFYGSTSKAAPVCNQWQDFGPVSDGNTIKVPFSNTSVQMGPYERKVESFQSPINQDDKISCLNYVGSNMASNIILEGVIIRCFALKDQPNDYQCFCNMASGKINETISNTNQYTYWSSYCLLPGT